VIFLFLGGDCVRIAILGESVSLRRPGEGQDSVSSFHSGESLPFVIPAKGGILCFCF